LKVIDELKNDDLFRAGSLMFFAVLFTGGINWLYQVIMGRTLGPEIYAEFGALFALSFFLSSILIRTIRVFMAGIVSRLKGKNKLKSIPKFHSIVIGRIIFIGILTFLIFAALSGVISEFLHIESITLILMVGLVFIFSWLVPVNLGVMQGLQRFKNLAATNFVQAISKFVFGVALVLLGFGIYGAIGGLVVGPLIALVVSLFLIKDIIKLPIGKTNPNKIITEDIRSESEDINIISFYVLIAITCLMIPTNIDVILVKHFFTNQETALYAAASVFGKMVFFLPVGISTALYPKVIDAHIKNQDTKRILRRGMVYTGIPSGILVIFLILFPRFFLGFYGEKYLDADSLLILYGPLMFFFALTAVLVYYNLAKNRYWFIYTFVALSMIEVGLVWMFHATLISILQIMLVMNIVIFISGMGISIFEPGD
jgi:O-antigen/teichoic acid export membrane protein